jgi:hypothetical protein
MEINGVNTKDMAHADAIELIKAGPTVRLVVKRGVGILPAALGKETIPKRKQAISYTFYFLLFVSDDEVLEFTIPNFFFAFIFVLYTLDRI